MTELEPRGKANSCYNHGLSFTYSVLRNWKLDIWNLFKRFFFYHMNKQKDNWLRQTYKMFFCKSVFPTWKRPETEYNYIYPAWEVRLCRILSYLSVRIPDIRKAPDIQYILMLKTNKSSARSARSKPTGGKAWNEIKGKHQLIKKKTFDIVYN